jgi:glycosyltransferase involved in cell wall biosynthesis
MTEVIYLKRMVRNVEGGKDMKEFAVVIPAFRPMKKFPSYIKQLLQENVPHIIVINDGSEKEYDNIFSQIESLKGCTVITHQLNSGKGAALKTGFTYFLKHFSYLNGIVTADADGQHATKDVLEVGKHLDTLEDGFVLGSRVFKKKHMPLRSWIGNRFTSLVFKLFFGKFIRDTQTGLRGITTKELDWVTQLSGDHFDYEMNMLINMVRKKKRIIRVDIAALYEDDHTSHFETYKDAKLIARAILSHYFKIV